MFGSANRQVTPLVFFPHVGARKTINMAAWCVCWVDVEAYLVAWAWCVLMFSYRLVFMMFQVFSHDSVVSTPMSSELTRIRKTIHTAASCAYWVGV